MQSNHLQSVTCARNSSPPQTQIKLKLCIFRSWFYWLFDVHQGTWAPWATLVWAVPGQWWLATAVWPKPACLLMFSRKHCYCRHWLRRVLIWRSLTNPRAELNIATFWLVNWKCAWKLSFDVSPPQPSTTLHNSPQRSIHFQRGERKRIWSSNSEQYCQCSASTGPPFFHWFVSIIYHILSIYTWRIHEKNSLADPTQKFDAIQVCSCVSQRLLWREKLRKIVLKYPTRTTSHFSGIGWSNNPKTGTVVSAEQPERMFFEQEDLGVVQHPSPDGMGWEPGRSRSGNNIEFTLRLFKVRKCS